MKKVLLIASIFFICPIVLSICASGEVLEGIVAIVNDEVILLSELKEAFRSAQESDSSVTEDKVLNGMINTMLLLIEAKRFRVGDTDYRPRNTAYNRRIIREFIDRRIKSFIHIPYEDIEYYYNSNREFFEGKEFYDVRDEIEEQMVEKESGSRLHEYMEELRTNAYIRIQLEQED